MSSDKSALVSMEHYGLDFSMSISLAVISSMICMIGLHIDHGPGMVEGVREDVFSKVVDLKNLVDLNPELREEKGFYDGYYMTLCALLLALDAYMEGELIDFGPVFELVKPHESSATNSNFEKFFH